MRSVSPVRQIPSPLQAVMLWLVAMALVVLGGMFVGAAAAAAALESGLDVIGALQLLADPKASPLARSAFWIATSVLTSEALLALVLWRWIRRHRVFLREVVSIAPVSLRDSAGALLCVFGLAPVSGFVAELVRRVTGREVTAETMVVSLARGLSWAELVAIVLAVALVPAIVEEAVFRGFILQAFSRLGNSAALLASSVMFGLFHLEPTQVAGTLVLGLGFGIARVYTGSVVPSMLGHFLYNAYVLVDVYAGGAVGDTELHLGRVGAGLCCAALGFGVLVWHPGERRHGTA